MSGGASVVGMPVSHASIAAGLGPHAVSRLAIVALVKMTSLSTTLWHAAFLHLPPATASSAMHGARQMPLARPTDDGVMWMIGLMKPSGHAAEAEAEADSLMKLAYM